MDLGVLQACMRAWRTHGANCENFWAGSQLLIGKKTMASGARKIGGGMEEIWEFEIRLSINQKAKCEKGDLG
jgi:hypothetical protein